MHRPRGVTQEELAELVHLHRNYVDGVERGERNISLLNIAELAHALRACPVVLLKFCIDLPSCATDVTGTNSLSFWEDN